MTESVISPPDRPFVSVAIPTHDRAELLERCIAGLVAQDYPGDRYEIVVADDGSRDATPAIVRAAQQRARAASPESPYPSVRYVRQHHGGPNQARNAAIRAAIGDPVCFVDDDIEVPPQWLSTLVNAAINDPAAGCLGGPIRTRLEGTPPRTCGREECGPIQLDLGGETRVVRYVWSGNMAMRRHAIAAVGLLQEHRLPGHDESEWMDRLDRAHIPVLYVAEAGVWHRWRTHDLNLPRLLSRRFTRGVGETLAYHRAGCAYVVDAQVWGIREGLDHARDARCSHGLLAATQHAGRLAALGPLRTWDRVRRRGPLPPPPG